MSKTSVYDYFDKHTADISAYAILKDGACVGRVVYRYPRDGMGRLYCYLQFWGERMTRGYASGCGYDKHTAAFLDALCDLPENNGNPDAAAHIARCRAGVHDNGHSWEDQLRGLGFTVQHVV